MDLCYRCAITGPSQIKWSLTGDIPKQLVPFEDSELKLVRFGEQKWLKGRED
jgi:hypothetical protein